MLASFIIAIVDTSDKEEDVLYYSQSGESMIQRTLGQQVEKGHSEP